VIILRCLTATHTQDVIVTVSSGAFWIQITRPPVPQPQHSLRKRNRPLHPKTHGNVTNKIFCFSFVSTKAMETFDEEHRVKVTVLTLNHLTDLHGSLVLYRFIIQSRVESIILTWKSLTYLHTLRGVHYLKGRHQCQGSTLGYHITPNIKSLTSSWIPNH
jgi:hypothetical protein